MGFLLQLLDVLLRWPRAAVRLGLLLSIPACLLFTLADAPPLVSVGVLSAWCVILAAAIDAAPPTDTIGLDMLLLALVAVRTMTGLDAGSADASRDPVWLVPLLLGIVHQCLAHLNTRDGRPDEEPHPNDSVYIARWLIVAGMFVAATGIGVMLVADSLSLVFVLLVAAEIVIGALVALALAGWSSPHGTGWRGGSWAFAAYAYLLLCGMVLARTNLELVVRIAGCVLVFVPAVLAVQHGPISTTKPVRAAEAVLDVVLACVDALGALLKSTVPYELAAIGSVAILLTCISHVWYTSTVIYPTLIQDVARIALILVDDVALPFFDFTSDSDFQATILPVTPEIATLRLAIDRAVRPSYRDLVWARDGKSAGFVPTTSGLLVATFVPVLLAALACIIQVLPNGAAFAKSRWFWAGAMVCGLASTLVAHLASDASIALWAFVFSDAQFTRTYTPVGLNALYAQLIFCGACLGMWTVLSLRAAAAAHDAAVVRPSLLARAAGAISSPPLVVTFAAVFIVVVVAMAPGGLPISHVGVSKFPDGAPARLQLTNADKLSALTTKLFDMLNPEIRLALIGNALIVFALDKAGCWGCLCLNIPSLSQLEDFGNSVGNAFNPTSWRRRMLEAHESRKLLGFDSCSKAACSGTQVCVSDILTDFIKEITSLARDGLSYASGFFTNQILSLIPGVSFLDDLLSKVPGIDGMPDLADLFHRPELNLSFRWSVLGLTLPQLHLPGLFGTAGGLPQLGLTDLIVVCAVAGLALLVVYKLGVLGPMLDAGAHTAGLAIVSGCITLLIAASVLLWELRAEIRNFGYQVNITWAPSVFWYALSLLLLVIALMLAVGQDDFRLVHQGAAVVKQAHASHKQAAATKKKPTQQPKQQQQQPTHAEKKPTQQHKPLLAPIEKKQAHVTGVAPPARKKTASTNRLHVVIRAVADIFRTRTPRFHSDHDVKRIPQGSSSSSSSSSPIPPSSH